MNATPDPRIVRFIRRHHVLTLATQREGQPHCAHLFYAYIEPAQRFVVTSDPATRHALEAADDERVGAAIGRETRIVGRIVGLQVRGLLRPTDDAACRRAYLRRFPYAAAADLHLWTLDARWMKLTDNTLGFGQKRLWTIEPQDADG